MRNNKRYAAAAERGFAVEEVARNVKNDIGEIDIIVHSLANGPEVKKPLLETSRQARCSALLVFVPPLSALLLDRVTCMPSHRSRLTYGQHVASQGS